MYSDFVFVDQHTDSNEYPIVAFSRNATITNKQKHYGNICNIRRTMLPNHVMLAHNKWKSPIEEDNIWANATYTK